MRTDSDGARASARFNVPCSGRLRFIHHLRPFRFGKDVSHFFLTADDRGWTRIHSAAKGRTDRKIPRPWERERMSAGQVRIVGEKQFISARVGVRCRNHSPFPTQFQPRIARMNADSDGARASARFNVTCSGRLRFIHDLVPCGR